LKNIDLRVSFHKTEKHFHKIFDVPDFPKIMEEQSSGSRSGTRPTPETCCLCMAPHDHTAIEEGYFRLLRNLTAEHKIELAHRLIESAKRARESKDTIASFYGAFQSPKSADEIIEEIREARTFTRDREAL